MNFLRRWLRRLGRRGAGQVRAVSGQARAGLPDVWRTPAQGRSRGLSRGQSRAGFTGSSWFPFLRRRVRFAVVPLPPLRRLAWAILPALAILLPILLLPRPDDQGPDAPAEVAEASVAPAGAFASGWVTLTDRVRRGDNLSGILLRNRLGMQEIGRVLELTRRLQLFSPARDLKADQTVTLERDEYGVLRRLTLCLSPEETYVYEARGDSLVAFLQPVERELRLRKFEGTIESSVDDAIRDAGGDYRLTLKFATAFEYDVDFFTEVQRGDRFSLLVEEKVVDGSIVGYGDILYGRYEGKRASGTAVWYRADGAPRGGYYAPDGKALKKSFLRAPLNYRRISSHFSKSRFHPIRRTWRPHHGVDYAAASGTPVSAVADGTVSFAGWKGGYGKVVKIRHSGGLETTYGHLSRISREVRSGARVGQGQVIGAVGATGLATGPHLHYEVSQKGARIDPLRMKNLPADPIPAGARGAYAEYVQGLEQLDEALLAGQVLDSFDPSRLTAAVAQLAAAGPGGAGAGAGLPGSDLPSPSR